MKRRKVRSLFNVARVPTAPTSAALPKPLPLEESDVPPLALEDIDAAALRREFVDALAEDQREQGLTDSEVARAIQLTARAYDEFERGLVITRMQSRSLLGTLPAPEESLRACLGAWTLKALSGDPVARSIARVLQALARAADANDAAVIKDLDDRASRTLGFASVLPSRPDAEARLRDTIMLMLDSDGFDPDALSAVAAVAVVTGWPDVTPLVDLGDLVSSITTTLASGPRAPAVRRAVKDADAALREFLRGDRDVTSAAEARTKAIHMIMRAIAFACHITDRPDSMVSNLESRSPVQLRPNWHTRPLLRARRGTT
jgi:hypothetical protein